MPAIKMDVHTTRSQDLCDEQPEFAIAKYGNTRSLWNGRLIENLTCRRERLNENSFLIGNRIGNHMQITSGNVSNSRNAPGYRTIPRTVSIGTCGTSHLLVHSHRGVVTSISATTRRLA